MATLEKITRAQQLLDSPDLGRCELICGEVVMMTPAGFEHSRIAMTLGALLRDYAAARGLGIVVGADAGFQIAHAPDTVRSPDVAFVRAARVGPSPPRGFFQGPPDLAVEVVSPSDRASEVTAKVHHWLDAGCLAVWVVDPQTRTVSVWRTPHEIAVLHESDALTAEDLLPGFVLPVAQVFAQ